MVDELSWRHQGISLQGLLGYLNFSEGRPDVRSQKQLNEAFGFLIRQKIPHSWQILFDWFQADLADLQASGASAFREPHQAKAVLDLAFHHVLPAYRTHHADLLFHLTDEEWFQPFFLARVLEAILAQGGPWEETARVVQGALNQLNDYIGYRPIVVLESRPRGEPYVAEKIRPVPLYLRGAGVAVGRYQDLIEQTIQILETTPSALLVDACFDPSLLDELALDPRAYDHHHPVNRRPNYIFGEWDPHHLDSEGRYRRFVVRRVTLDALLERIEHPESLKRDEALWEAATILAGTMLMAAGVSGSSPSTHDSTTTLSSLMQRIAPYRDAFYTHWLQKLGSSLHGTRLRQEAALLHQPFGGARQHLNAALARHRAAQLQQRHMALLFAEMGYSEASQQEAARIPAASVRLLSEILSKLTLGAQQSHNGCLAEAAAVLPEIEEMLDRGIACGALVDPWNILGFQALFPLFQAREDSVHDPRVDELIEVMDRLFNLYAHLLSEAAAAGAEGLVKNLTVSHRRLAKWWDRFASVEVSDVRHVHGGESAESARQVAAALERWHQRGEAIDDLAFWRKHLHNFHSPKAFYLVVEALLRKKDYRAAMSLLMSWLGQMEQVPLEDGEYSFYALSLRWMLEMTTAAQQTAGNWPLIQKFFDYLEANAEDYWQIPTLQLGRWGQAAKEEEADGTLFSAAYENVVYHDTTDDGEEGALADGSRPSDEFDLDTEGERIGKHLRFLTMTARLWQIAARCTTTSAGPIANQETLLPWLSTAQSNLDQLMALLDAIHAYPVPEPMDAYDSLVEYDRRRGIKEHLLYTAIHTCLDHALAVGALAGASLRVATVASPAAPFVHLPVWAPLAIQLEQALFQGDPAAARAVLPEFLRLFQEEPLLFASLADGGQPRQILRVHLAQAILKALASNLPRLGLLRETYHLLKIARYMEQAHAPEGRRVSEFNHLFQVAYQAVIENVVRSAATWETDRGEDRSLVDLLETLSTPFLSLWVEHSHILQLAALEAIRSEAEWRRLQQFVRSYGRDLFHARFMTLANLRGILHRGVGAYLDHLRDHPDPLHPCRLVEELNDVFSRDEAVACLQLILQSVIENYEEYKDYNTTTAQSDYGDNLYILLDFLRLKTSYERRAWQFRPLILAHEVLARLGRNEAAVLWQEAFMQGTHEIAVEHVETLSRLEQLHGVRLSTVHDRLHQRFVQPLVLDRLCALIEPSMHESRQIGEHPMFARLLRELETFVANPSGAGLDVPDWLRRLETEIHRVRTTQSAVAVLSEHLFRMPQRSITFADLQQQLQEWEKTL